MYSFYFNFTLLKNTYYKYLLIYKYYLESLLHKLNIDLTNLNVKNQIPPFICTKCQN